MCIDAAMPSLATRSTRTAKPDEETAMSRYSAELASNALLSTLPVFRTGLPILPALIALDEPEPTAPIRHLHRDRDAAFGIGYGNSSGYGLERQYISDWGPRRFRFM